MSLYKLKAFVTCVICGYNNVQKYCMFNNLHEAAIIIKLIITIYNNLGIIILIMLCWGCVFVYIWYIYTHIHNWTMHWYSLLATYMLMTSQSHSRTLCDITAILYSPHTYTEHDVIVHACNATYQVCEHTCTTIILSIMYTLPCWHVMARRLRACMHSACPCVNHNT